MKKSLAVIVTLIAAIGSARAAQAPAAEPAQTPASVKPKDPCADFKPDKQTPAEKKSPPKKLAPPSPTR